LPFPPIISFAEHGSAVTSYSILDEFVALVVLKTALPIKAYLSQPLVWQRTGYSLSIKGQKPKCKMTNENAKRSKLTQAKNGCFFIVVLKEHPFGILQPATSECRRLLSLCLSIRWLIKILHVALHLCSLVFAFSAPLRWYRLVHASPKVLIVRMDIKKCLCFAEGMTPYLHL